MKCEHCGKEVDAKMITWDFHYLLGICPECGGIIVLERGEENCGKQLLLKIF